MEVIGVLNSIWILWREMHTPSLQLGAYAFLLMTYLFLRICDWVPWYPGEPRDIGIQVHFRKALVPTSYILAVTSSLVVLNVPFFSTFLLLLADLMMLVVAPVNGIILYFHFKDRSALPINYFTRNLYFKEDGEVMIP